MSHSSLCLTSTLNFIQFNYSSQFNEVFKFNDPLLLIFYHTTLSLGKKDHSFRLQGREVDWSIVQIGFLSRQSEVTPRILFISLSHLPNNSK